MDFMTREVFDTLIIVVIIIGLILAAWRLHADFTRPLPDNRPAWSDEDTAEHQPVVDQDTEEEFGTEILTDELKEQPRC